MTDERPAAMAVTIRPIRPVDRADWDRLWAGYLRFYETTLPRAVSDATFARLVSGDPAEPAGLLAVAGGRVAGLAHFLFHRSTWSACDTCYLQDLYADPAARGAGIGRALIEAVYAAAAARGADPVYWLTQEHNGTARRLYDRVAALTPFRVYEHATA